MSDALDRFYALTRSWSSAIMTAAAALGVATYANRRSIGARWMPPGGRVVQTSSLSARVLGETGPPVLLLHGLVASGLYWGGAYDRLARHHRLVVPDLLGFGRSPRPPSGYGPDEHVSALLACLDELGIDGPVVVGAHSLGALIALRLAATHPERVTSVVAFGPPLYPDAQTARAHVRATSPMARLFVLPGGLAETACRWTCDHRALAGQISILTHPSLPPAVAADGVQHSWASYAETLQEVILAAEGSTWVDQVGCPALLVAGDRDPVVDHDYLRQVAFTHDNFELLEQSGDHNMALRRPDECAAMIEAAAY